MIVAKQAVLHRSGTRVLGPLDLPLRTGSITALVGPNGAGKSTLIEALAGTLRPTSGTITLDGTAVHTLDPASRRRALAVYTQASAGPTGLRALDVCLFGSPNSSAMLGLPSAADTTLALSWMTRLGVDALADRPMQRLSGGERQRILVARALTQSADVLLLDEPTSAQDYTGAALIAQALRQRQAQGGTTIVAIHDAQLALNLADHVVVLDSSGLLRASSSPADAADAIEELYSPWVKIACDDGRFVVHAQTDGNALASSSSSD